MTVVTGVKSMKQLQLAAMSPLLSEVRLREIEASFSQEDVAEARALDIRDRCYRADILDEVEAEASQLVGSAVDWHLQTTQRRS